jgi:hypothetical protein
MLMVSVQVACTCCLFSVPDRTFADAELETFICLQNLLSGPSPPEFFLDVIFLEEDAAELDKKLKDNSELPEPSRLSVKSIKQGFIKQVLDQQPDRCERFKAHDFSSSEPFPTKVTILDFTSLDVARLPFRDESYILVRQDYGEVMAILESRRKGGMGSVCITGQPGIGEVERSFVHAHRDVDTVHRKKLFSLVHSFAALEG